MTAEYQPALRRHYTPE